MSEPATTEASPSRAPLGWAASLAVPGVALLAALDVTLYLMHALGYGMSRVLSPALSPDGSEIPSPADAPYLLAFGLGAVLTLTLAPILARLAQRTRARSWPAPALGLAAAVVASLTGASGLLLTLGISPVEFVAAF